MEEHGVHGAAASAPPSSSIRSWSRFRPGKWARIGPAPRTPRPAALGGRAAAGAARQTASILDWIAQVDQKDWITSTDLGDLVRLMNELLPFQQHYCGCEVDRTANPVAILGARQERRLTRTR